MGLKAKMMNTSSNPEHLLEAFWQLFKQQQFDAATQYSSRLQQEFPHVVQGWHAAAVLAAQQHKLQEALDHIEQALSLEADNLQCLLLKIRLLINKGQRIEAKALALQLSQQTYANAAIYAELALLLNTLKLHTQALDCYQRAHLLAPNDAGILFNLASLQRYMGHLAAAEKSLDRVIGLNPQDSEAWLLRSSLRKQQADNNHVQALEMRIAQTSDPVIGQVQLHYALAKELEDLQQYARCFKALSQGARLRRKNMQYDVQQDVATINKIIEVFAADVFKHTPRGYHSKQPIFILGLPRTGSTLVERIIDSHSDVHSAGELNTFALQMMAQIRSKQHSAPANKLAVVELSRQLDFAALGESYIKNTQSDGEQHKHVIDKLPLNSLYAGLIHLALPEAKIIYITRHPMDTCFAIYKQLFTNGYPFSYELSELAQYQIAHQRLMQHWQTVMPGVIYQLSYEQLVTDLPTQARKLIDFCALPWQPQCAHFEQNKAASTTASAAQVRQGVYSSSVGKWRHFSDELAQVKQTLQAAGLHCD